MNFKETAAWLLERDNFIILTHRRPDGDTVGCALALCHALREQGKTAYVEFNEDLTTQFNPYFSGMYPPRDWDEPSTVVSVDVAAYGLFPHTMIPWLERGIDLAIDHHPSYEGFGDEDCVDASRAACGELVYDIIRQWGAVSATAALPLYIAISTDTGGFIYSNTTASTHRIVADLMDTGIDFYAANRRHLSTKTMGQIKLEAHLVATMECHDDGALVLGGISMADMEHLGTTADDAEEISSFLGTIKGVETAATMRELESNQWKVSLRTNGLNATKVCQEFGGGGHAAAAGGTIMGDFTQAKKVLLTAIRKVQNHG